jgi:hypothetical protein
LPVAELATGYQREINANRLTSFIWGSMPAGFCASKLRLFRQSNSQIPSFCSINDAVKADSSADSIKSQLDDHRFANSAFSTSIPLIVTLLPNQGIQK